jgi:ABC-type Fe3+/spermidine/putrescine transport system ATPase subunit
VAVMNAGHIEQVGTPDEIYDFPQSRFVADFIGLSDFVQATVSSIDSERETVVVAARGVDIVIPAGAEMASGQSVLLFVRPNDVELLPASSVTGSNVFSGTVDKMTYLGDRNDYRVVIGEGLGLRVQTDGKVRFEEGEPVKVHLPVDRCRVILE